MFREWINTSSHTLLDMWLHIHTELIHVEHELSYGRTIECLFLNIFEKEVLL